MKKLVVSCLLVVAMLSSCCNSSKNLETAVIPAPQSMKINKGAFKLADNQVIGISDKSLEGAASYLSKVLSATGYTFTTVEGAGDITISIDASQADKVSGSYSLTVTLEGVNIVAVDYKGAINGITTFRQLLGAQIESSEVVVGKEWYVANVEICDSPAYEWRGLMLDVSRHFYTKEEVKEFLDLMALYKLNKFHWHLTDDQGWRIEIKKYPLLTEVGGWREFNSHDKTCIERAKSSNNSDFELPKDKLKEVDGKTYYGGFYTQEDIKEIVSHATSLGIDIIPEIDMPGHILVALENYDGISCFKTTGWGATFSSPVCPGKESAMAFCKDVYKEIFELFPNEYVHLGADEVEKTNWKKCPDCQKLMRKYGLKTEDELQAWFVKDMEKYFNENGKKLIGWDEILEGGLSETATIMWWRSWVGNAVKEATASGNEAILTPNSYFYFDYDQDQSTIKNIYNSNVISDLTEEQKELVKGYQANIWCEWIPSRERMQYMVYPRALAVAEKAWSGDANSDWDDFSENLERHLERLDVLNVNYRIADFEDLVSNKIFIDEIEVDFACPDKNVVIRYTEDGSIPTIESKQYTKPFTITESKQYKVAPFRKNGNRGDIYDFSYTKTPYTTAVEVDSSEEGLNVVWHDFRGNRCDRISKAPVKESMIANEVAIPEGVKGNIGLIFTGYFVAPYDDIYTFALRSDDGSVLKIGDTVVVDNDGPHSPKEVKGQVALSSGHHPLHVSYFDSNGGVLSLVITDSDGDEISQDDHFVR
ncbi:MAG: family 20 glycosylhydrolase [Rikenellaceae bacterium]